MPHSSGDRSHSRSRYRRNSRDRQSKRRDSNSEDGRARKSSPFRFVKKEKGDDGHELSSSKKHKKDKKKEKKKKRSESSNSRSSDSSVIEETYDPDFRIKLEQQRVVQKEHRRVQKEKMKSFETPEEKRARRLAKKLTKEQKKKEALGWNEEHAGYSNMDNPFGDTKLTETFMWTKKLQKEGKADLPKELVEKEQRGKVDKNREEMEKLKNMRLERERQRGDREMMMREQGDDQMEVWAKQEDKFHLKQAKLRSQIRRKEGRAKAIDLLAGYIHVEENEEDMDIDMQEPYHFLNGLSIRDLEDLMADIRVYENLEGSYADYWRDVTIITEDELSKLKKAESANDAQSRESIHTSVSKDVTAIFKGKSHSQLALLETEILRKMKSQHEGVDVGYWEALLSHLKAHMARARLRDRHKQTLNKKLNKLKGIANDNDSKPVVKEEPSSSDIIDQPMSPVVQPISEPKPEAKPESSYLHVEIVHKEIPWEELTSDEKIERSVNEYIKMEYEPKLLRVNPAGSEFTTFDVDKEKLQMARERVKQGKPSQPTTSAGDSEFDAAAKKGMGGDEVSFGVEVPLEQKQYLWSEKYRARKPRYFNRVHTGFEWNKYNQTHYDLDNPPPKIVQGYKFNIFYPDLLDPSMIPQFVLIPCEDDDFAVLKFTAGPPYEDIAFKIVCREWEVSHKRGYRCAFQNGIFQLWFHFKKYRYRR